MGLYVSTKTDKSSDITDAPAEKKQGQKMSDEFVCSAEQTT